MEFSLDEKLKLAGQMCNRDNENMHKFNAIYPFTTENIKAYLPLFDLNNKSLFTVGSSGDQALNAILCGSKDIMVFDICPFAREYFYLKMAAIISLTRDEFLRFFCHKGYFKRIYYSNDFDVKLYPIIKETLRSISSEVEYFWNEVFKKYGSGIVRKQLFSLDGNRREIIEEINYYLNSNLSYNELKNKVDKANVNFVQGDIFADKVIGNFDNIFLSNLSSYYSLAQIRSLYDKMLPHLNDDGQMMIAYLYETTLYSDDYMEGEAEIYNIPKVIKTFPQDIEFNSFLGVRGISLNTHKIRDSVITYRKVKKK